LNDERITFPPDDDRPVISIMFAETCSMEPPREPAA
jgi:hypothetical protein